MQTLTRSAVSAGSAHPPPLTPAEVEASRRRGGSNRLTQKPRRGFWRRFLANLGDPVIRILLCALGLNLLFAFILGPTVLITRCRLIINSVNIFFVDT